MIVDGFVVIGELPFPGVRLPATVALGAVALIGYMVSHARSGKTEFGVMDALIVSVLVAIVGATSIPVLEMVSRQAKTSAMLQDLHTLRSQIALYKLEHHGEPPMLYEGSFPQLIRPTNAEGVPGVPGSKYPYGPYLARGVPLNPLTGRSIVTASEDFPPTEPSGNGGWLYHPPTGQIVIDLAEFVDR